MAHQHFLWIVPACSLIQFGQSLMKELWDKLDGNSDKSHGLTMLHLPSRLPTVKHLGLFIILYLYHAPTQSVKARNLRKLWTLEDLQRQIPFKDFRMECRFGMIWVLLDSGMLRLPKAKASWSMLTLHHPMRYKRNQNNQADFNTCPPTQHLFTKFSSGMQIQ